MDAAGLYPCLGVASLPSTARTVGCLVEGEAVAPIGTGVVPRLCAVGRVQEQRLAAPQPGDKLPAHPHRM